jgi:hypothetical protein
VLEVDRGEHEAVGAPDLELAKALLLPPLGSRVIDLENPQATHEIVAAVGERVETGTKNHVLVDPAAYRLFDQVLREARADTDPAAEGHDVRAGKLTAKTLPEDRALITGEAESKIVVEDERRGFLAVKVTCHRSQDSGATRSPKRTAHRPTIAVGLARSRRRSGAKLTAGRRYRAGIVAVNSCI